MNRSLISIDRDSSLSGVSAQGLKESNYQNTIGAFKRLIHQRVTSSVPGVMGGKASEVDPAWLYEKFSQIKLVENTDTGFHIKIQASTPCLHQYTYPPDCQSQMESGGEKAFPVIRLIAALLHSVSEIVSQVAKSLISKFVIAVPAWFTDNDRGIIVHACSMAGLGPVGFIKDVTAAALNFGITHPVHSNSDTPTQAVYIDIGHSGSSVIVVAFSKQGMLIKSVVCDPHLGGHNIDCALACHFAKELNIQNISVLADVELLDECQRVKETLSAMDETILNFDSVDGTSYKALVTREILQSLISDILVHIVVLIENALSESGLTQHNIDIVELSGGSTKIPAIKDIIQACFPGRILSTINAQGVAQGALHACSVLPVEAAKQDFYFSNTTLYPLQSPLRLMEWTKLPCEHMSETDTSNFKRGEEKHVYMLDLYSSAPEVGLLSTLKDTSLMFVLDR